MGILQGGTVAISYKSTGADAVSREATAVSRDLKNTGAAGATGAKGVSTLSSAMGIATKAAGALGVALSVDELIDFSAEAFNAALAAEVHAEVLNTVAGSAENAAATLDAVQRATRGTINTSDAAALSAKLLSLGLADSAESAEKFTYAAATLGKSFRNMGAEESVALFNQMISNRSIKLLDDFGIGIADVNAKMAEMGQTGQEAFQSAVIEIATQRAEELGGVWDTNATKMEQFNASWQDLKQEFGEEIVVPVVIRVVEGADILFFKGPQMIEDAAAQAAQAMVHESASADDLAEQLQALNDVVREGNGVEQRAAEARKIAIVQLRAEQIAAEQGLSANDAYAAAFDEMVDSTLTFANNLRITTDAQERATEATDTLTAAGSYAYRQQAQLAEGMGAVDQSAAALAAREAAVARAEEEAAAAAEAHTKALEDQYSMSSKLGDLVADHVDQYGYLGQTVTVSANATGVASDKLSYYQDQAEAAQERLQELTWQQEAFAAAGMDLSDQIVAASTELAGYTDAANAASTATQGIGQTYTYTIDQLSTEDLKSVGEGILQFFEMTGHTADIAGAGLINIQREYLGVSESAIAMQQALDDVDQALSNQAITGQQAADIVGQILVGNEEATTALLNQAQAQNDHQTAVENSNLAYENAVDQAGYLANMLDEDLAGAMEAVSGQMTEQVPEATATADEAITTTAQNVSGLAGDLGNANVQLERLASNLSKINGAHVSGSISVSMSTAAGVEQHNATGTDYAKGGMSIVGEEGPEAMFVPRGSAIATAKETKDAFTGGGGTTQVVNVDLGAGRWDMARLLRDLRREAARVGRPF